jgi:hypothetical protein
VTRGIVVDPTPVSAPSAPAPAQQQQNPAPADDGLPDKFKGKSIKDVVAMYTNLESETGRLRNELGDTRADARTWRSLAEELTTVSKQPAPTKREPVEITPDQLVAKPKESIQAVVEEALASRLEPIVNSTQSLQRNAEVDAFVRDFPNYVEVGQSQEFQHFVGKSKRRLSLAERALQKQDIGAMRDLMEQWEERRALIAELNPPAKEPAKEQPSAPTGIEGARQVATEKPGNGGAVPNTKVFYENDVIQTLLQNPDKYYSEPYQQELLKAMQEGRYKK